MLLEKTSLAISRAIILERRVPWRMFGTQKLECKAQTAFNHDIFHDSE